VEFWDSFFDPIITIPFTESSIKKAFEIILQLKQQRKLIDKLDIMIAATAMDNNMPLAR
jgi:predicted nucleic acid-binding protein